MGWSFDAANKVWKCTKFNDLQYAEINNFAEYGQPVSPYEPGYDHNHVTDFKNIVIEMPQREVMDSGYGRNITALDFPLVSHFLHNGVMMGDTPWMAQWLERNIDRAAAFAGFLPRLPPGRHKLSDLITRGMARERDRRIKTNLYGWGSYGIDSGNISAGDAAYIHGSVGFALMLETVFVVEAKERRVEAEIGAGDDNWDFESGNIPAVVNAAVATILGPTHYNLESPIRILFRGRGKMMLARHRL